MERTLVTFTPGTPSTAARKVTYLILHRIDEMMGTESRKGYMDDADEG